MRYSTASILSTFFWSLTLAASLEEREVPQEHSHEEVLNKVRETLNKDNPDKIKDPVFGLLGDGAAKQGAGNIKNLACLQRSIADQAFTNAKKTNDIDAMTNAVLFAGLERNTGSVGKESETCTIPAKNPEINAMRQHQDPASPNAAENNKEVVLEAARQIASFGGDPQLAAKTATFAPGQIGDPTAAGNSCNDKDDPVGCIFTKKLIQIEATPEEITAATNSVSKNTKRHHGIDHSNEEKENSGTKKVTLNKRNTLSNSKKLNSKRGFSSLPDQKSQVFHKRDDDDNRGNRGGRRNRSNRNNQNDDKKKRDNGIDENLNVKRQASGENVQSFTGSLGSLPPAVIEDPKSDRPFTVNGNTFVGKSVALQRSCSIQKNSCANAANSGSGSVSDCEKQEAECNEQAKLASKRSISSSVSKTRQRINRKRNTPQLVKKQQSDFGSCSDPTVEFKAGFDGRADESFKAKNQADFGHGSTQKLKITSDFICERLQSTCKAPEETVDKCQAASKAAESLSGKEAADAFNKGVGA